MSTNSNLNFVGNEVVHGELEITVIRKDGTIEPMGVVSYYHMNPLLQAKWEIEKLGQLQPETVLRLRKSAKDKMPYIVTGVVSAGLGLFVWNKFK